MKLCRNKILLICLLGILAIVFSITTDWGVVNISQRLMVSHPLIGVGLLRFAAWSGSEIAHRSLWQLAKALNGNDEYAFGDLNSSVRKYLDAHGVEHLEKLAQLGDSSAKAELAYLNLSKSSRIENPTLENAFVLWRDAAKAEHTISLLYLGFGVLESRLESPLKEEAILRLKGEAKSNSYYAKDARELLEAIRRGTSLAEMIDQEQLLNSRSTATSWLRWVNDRH